MSVQKKVVNGTEYEIHTLKMGTMRKLMPALQGEAAQQAAAHEQMVAESVYKDGVQLKEIIDDLEFADYLELSSLIVEINGLGNVE
jgi:hypothetical protein